MSRRLLFRLTQAQAEELIALAVALEPWMKRNTTLDRATIELDEQMANTVRNTWDRCPNCNGTGIIDEV